MKEQNGKDYFTVKEIVEEVGVSKQSIYKWIEQLKKNVPNMEKEIIQIEGIQYLSSDILDYFKKKSESINEVKAKAEKTKDFNQLETENRIQKEEIESLKVKVQELESELKSARQRIDSLLDELIDSGKEQRRLNERILAIEYRPKEETISSQNKAEIEQKDDEIKRLKEELEKEKNKPKKKGLFGLFG